MWQWKREHPVVREALSGIRYHPRPRRRSLDYLETHLKAAIILTEHKIPAVVFGNEALMCAHGVQYLTPYTLQLLLPNDRKTQEQAVSAILGQLQNYARYPDTPGSLFGDLQDPPSDFMLDELGDPSRALPTSICLRSTDPLPVTAPEEPFDAPSYILLTPTSVFEFNLSDPANTKTLPGFPPGILFPTLIPLLDSLFHTRISAENVYLRYEAGTLFYRLVEYVFPGDARGLRSEEDLSEPPRVISQLLKEDTRKAFIQSFILLDTGSRQQQEEEEDEGEEEDEEEEEEAEDEEEEAEPQRLLDVVQTS
ncbi:hypothetical protein OF83DRAFT_443667 [Amylostereum chailletii]|nr:hypothetical protein OF83DRAFT_443667 [Amylostereum chailletii]